jgi:hypothetical protein
MTGNGVPKGCQQCMAQTLRLGSSYDYRARSRTSSFLSSSEACRGSPCLRRNGGNFSSAYEALRGGGGGGASAAPMEDDDGKAHQAEGLQEDGDSEGSPPRGRDAMSPEYAEMAGE